MDDLAPPIPAATLVLMRPAGAGAPELLMMERPRHMTFAAGALVFPGGRIESQDEAAAKEWEDGSDEAAARIAAVRETIEETGVAAGLRPVPSAVALARLRENLLGGEAFAGLLAAAGLAIALDTLTPFARWCPNFRETRRFDARFYLAEAEPGAPEPSPQPGEATRAFWATASDVLAQIDAGAAQAIFPTRRNLERLARFGSVAEALADAARHPARTITPWIEQREGAPWLCIPTDAGYPITAEPLATARRG